MQNKLTDQLNILEKSVTDSINAPFMKKADFIEKTALESLQMCRLLVEQNNTLNERLEMNYKSLIAENMQLKQKLEALTNG